MVENLKEAMKINRKKARETIYNNTDGYKKKVYWDNSLQSWVVVDNKIARSILTSSNYSADRKGEFIDQIDATQKQKNVLKEFYTNWLMYKEGENHEKLRKLIQKAVNQIKEFIPEISQKVTKTIMSQKLEYIDAVNDVAKPYTNLFLSQIFGLSKEKYSQVLESAQEAVNFLWIANPSKNDVDKTVASIEKITKEINEIILTNNYDKDGLFKTMLENSVNSKTFTVALINMIIDGHEPFQSSLLNLIFNYLHIKNRENVDICDKDIVNESIRMEPPFSYCARVCVVRSNIEDKVINVGERIMTILYVSNNNHLNVANPTDITCKHSKKENLSFGFGKHHCLGAQMTTISLECFLKSFRKLDFHYKWRIVNYQKETTYGFFEINKMIIESESQK